MPENNSLKDQWISEDLKLISDGAREAGHIAIGFFKHNPKIWQKEGNSPVTEADFAVDRYLKELLLKARPQYGWISEETADERPAQDYQRFFVVDPIDGTRGFIEGKNNWCISIAIIENGRPICGVLHCPVTGEHFIAPVNGKAYNNDMVLAIANDDHLRRPIVSCAGSWMKKITPSLRQDYSFKADVPSLAYRLALFASGKVDMVLVRPNAHDWDIAAADIIVECAGGALLNRQKTPIIYGKEPFCHSILIAASAKDFKIALDIVHKALKD
ncbi:3'(2'),5'-bisphosphate nucleotidase CysQ [Bartonella sp. HY329]|uniref:3'(2'),5'-bisphosphate nucleotidase CysQ n=1 Tax=unclassified Bartonella TaxID=2645622 RepID=UPI0021CA0741|nr:MULTISPECIES: 3'(2'),5'-bisphosphate nucleotidase CysQ [unclassified Bartonella]UXM95458.1 3'(2'),5'-bisphosphate nucleotidase CysQ [Bartonella sp. HY329]UXN09784.1 3'(2'),5'-bisphosphate nucleotidase CysQ [Bartonella sp. HY328]